MRALRGLGESMFGRGASRREAPAQDEPDARFNFERLSDLWSASMRDVARYTVRHFRPEGRHRQILKEFEFFMKSPELSSMMGLERFDLETRLSVLQQLGDEDFVRGCERILSAYLDRAARHPVAFVDAIHTLPSPLSQWSVKDIREGGSLYYEEKEGEIVLHAPLFDVVSWSGVLEEVRKDFRTLARIIADKPTIRKISMTSWLVPRIHSILKEKLFFEYEGIVPEDQLPEEFEGSSDPIGRASLSRQEFLRHYGAPQERSSSFPTMPWRKVHPPPET